MEEKEDLQQNTNSIWEFRYDFFLNGLFQFALTAFLMVLKLGYGWNISWLAVLVPIWVPGALIHFVGFLFSAHCRIMALMEDNNQNDDSNTPGYE